MPLKFNSQLNFIFKKNYKQIDYCFLGGEMVFLFLFFIDVVAQNYDFLFIGTKLWNFLIGTPERNILDEMWDSPISETIVS